jgi:ribosome-associated translation inhibitor RaiA
MLAEYTVERRKDGWYFGRSARYGAKEEAKGPYRSVSSVTLVIARQLKREITKRDARHGAEA